MAVITWSGTCIPTNKNDIVLMVAGAAINKFDMVYRDTADENKAKPTDSSDANTAQAYGMALHDASTGEYVAVAIDGATINVGGGPVAKSQYVVSGTSGDSELQSDLTAGEYICQTFYALTATQIKIDIYYTGQTA